MHRRILITGGAGFIGSHVADELLRHGYEVRILDPLIEQVHGESGARPSYLDPEVELRVGDVRDPVAVRAALEGVEAVFHLAALVGVGQSMYQIADYTSVNDLGTATLLEAVAARPVQRLVVASSMSVYGEGLYLDEDGRHYEAARRSDAALARGQWEPRSRTGSPLSPVPTPESKRPSLESIYALGKFGQEQSALIVGRAYRIPTVALRFFNVYGPRQALSNPYTGVLAIFAARYLGGRQPVLFEDGRQRRDFVNVKDVARACRLALETTNPDAIGSALNVGSGRSLSVREVAESMAHVLGRSDLEPVVTNEYRSGDIRHCYADIDRAQATLGYRPEVTFEDGIAELSDWLSSQIVTDRLPDARRELRERGLTL